jgi:hypothetical protein
VEFDALIARNRDREKRKYERAGEIAATTMNVNRNAERRPTPFTAADVFPWIEDKKDEGDNSAALDLYFTGLAAEFRKANPGTPAPQKRKVSRSEMVDG